MAEGSLDVSEIAATRVVVALLIFVIFSLVILGRITHNIYVSSYYTLSALFDANGEGSQAVIAALLQHSGSYLFDGFFFVSIIDGLAKAVIIGFLLAASINLLSSIDLKSKFQVITAKHMKGHTIVCGYSMLAEQLCDDLQKSKEHFVVIDSSPEKIAMLRDLKFNAIEGDFTERAVLEGASIGKAKAIVFATESDFINLLGIVTAHHMNPDLKIISRSRHESSVRKMQRGGASVCLVPEVVAGIELGERIAKQEV
jgi:hypothetical protein